LLHSAGNAVQQRWFLFLGEDVIDLLLRASEFSHSRDFVRCVFFATKAPGHQGMVKKIAVLYFFVV
jgi:hypothetical protein